MFYCRRPLLLLFAATPLAAQSYDVVLDGGKSSTSLAASLEVLMPGELIGDYDKTTNPGGTLTRPGLFGGSGNQPVDVTALPQVELDLAGAPAGGFAITADTMAGTLVVDGLALELLGGASGTGGLVLELTFETFRTFSPDSLYLGGIPLPIPLGEALVRDVQVAQIAAAEGTLVPLDNGGELYAFSVAVPAALVLEVEALGQVFPVGPLPILLPLTGELELAPASARVEASVVFQDAQTIPDPLPGFSIDDLPVDLPTILPPGNVAHVLFTLLVESIGTELSIALELVGDGEPVCGFEVYCAANPNSTGSSASISASGSTVVAAADLTLTVVDVPVGECGYFVMSANRTFVPLFGNSQGNLCVGSPQVRFSQDVLYPDPAGVVTFEPDFSALPQEVVFEPGSRWNFQLWFRDQNPGTTSNTSDAVEVQFCP